MEKIKGYQKQYLKGLAHDLKPLVFIGGKGTTAALFEAVQEALDKHELIKIKFNDFKQKEQKAEILERIEKETRAEMVGMVGHVAILYRPQDDPEKRRIELPQRSRG